MVSRSRETLQDRLGNGVGRYVSTEIAGAHVVVDQGLVNRRAQAGSFLGLSTCSSITRRRRDEGGITTFLNVPSKARTESGDVLDDCVSDFGPDSVRESGWRKSAREM
jgi:hypothetical protein